MKETLFNQGYLIEKDAICPNALHQARSVKQNQINSCIACDSEKDVLRIPSAYGQISSFRPVIKQALKSQLLAEIFKGLQILNFSLLRQPFKGFGAQKLHRDNNKETEEIIGFISLDKIDNFNGPLELRPYSHIKNSKFKYPTKKIKMRPGDIIWYLPKLEHGGTKNLSGKSRRVIIISVTKQILHPKNSLDERKLLKKSNYTASDLRLLLPLNDC